MSKYLFLIIIVIASLFAILFTFLLGHFFPQKRLLKYVPSLLALGGSIGFFIKASYFAEGFQDIAFILMGIIAGVLAVVTLITATIIEILNNR